MDSAERAEKAKNVQEPQNHGDNYNRIQDVLDGTLHGYVSVNQPKKDPNHDQDHYELNQRHDTPH
jgi:hypothetical protein